VAIFFPFQRELSLGSGRALVQATTYTVYSISCWSMLATLIPHA